MLRVSSVTQDHIEDLHGAHFMMTMVQAFGWILRNSYADAFQDVQARHWTQ